MAVVIPISVGKKVLEMAPKRTIGIPILNVKTMCCPGEEDNPCRTPDHQKTDKATLPTARDRRIGEFAVINSYTHPVLKTVSPSPEENPRTR